MAHVHTPACIFVISLPFENVGVAHVLLQKKTGSLIVGWRRETQPGPLEERLACRLPPGSPSALGGRARLPGGLRRAN